MTKGQDVAQQSQARGRSGEVRSARMAAAALVGLVAASTAPGTAAHAAMREGTSAAATADNNRYVAVAVSGHVSGAKRLSVPSPPALCWWDPWPAYGGIDPDDAQAVHDYWWDGNGRPTGHAAMGQLSVASEADFAAAIEADKDEPGITWYNLSTSDAIPGGGDPGDRASRLVDAGCSFANDTEYMGTPVIVSLRYFPFRQPPPPRVDPEVLAQYAYEVMDLVDPTLDWNPKIGNNGGAALLNVPTWVWVDQAASVGVREVTATAGDVSVTVTARTNGISVSSPAGGAQCSAEQARTRFAAGVAESQACVIDFTRASYGHAAGFPVRASTSWTATWTSTTGEGGDLGPRELGEVTNIPVAGSQALVTEVG